MPERHSTALDARLARGRADLLDTIDQPPLARVRARAAARRRRRRRAVGGSGLLAVAVAAALVVRPWAGTDAPSPPVADTPPEAPVYTAAGITINGLTNTGILQIRGDIADVEFTDPDHGYLLARCRAPDPCGSFLARTNDGGVTWTGNEVPLPAADDQGVDLLAFPDERLVLAGAGYASDDGGRNWRALTTPDIAVPTPARPGDLLRPGPGSDRCDRSIEVWQRESRGAGVPLRQPGINVCWVAPVAATDGARWAGGTAGAHAALAVTRDGGETWQTVPLDAPGQGVTSVEVTTLGGHAYAVVLGPDRAIRGIFHSADGGRTFTRTRVEDAGAPRALAGAMVPLLDGRLLVVGTDQRWYVSADDGRTFARAEGNLPAVGGVARTAAGYVAYDLFGGGWAAYSSDGSTWRKLQVN